MAATKEKHRKAARHLQPENFTPHIAPPFANLPFASRAGTLCNWRACKAPCNRRSMRIQQAHRSTVPLRLDALPVLTLRYRPLIQLRPGAAAERYSAPEL